MAFPFEWMCAYLLNEEAGGLVDILSAIQSLSDLHVDPEPCDTYSKARRLGVFSMMASQRLVTSFSQMASYPLVVGDMLREL